MRICILKTTGRLIEAQSNDAASLDNLIENAKAAGFLEKEIEVKIVSDMEYQEILDNLPENLASKDRLAREKTDIEEALPSWAAVDQAITNVTTMADAKQMLRKLARVIYWLAKKKAD